MSRFQLALDVDDLEAAIGFYERLLGQPPSKRRPGYANFAVAEPPLKLVLLENPGKGGTINHLGVEVESSDKVHAEIARLTGEGLFTDEEIGTTCCFATQDKVWVTGPAGEADKIKSLDATVADGQIFKFGSLDVQVDDEQNAGPMEAALNEAGNEDFAIVTIVGANHLFQAAETGALAEYMTLPKEFTPEFLPTVTDWLLDHVDVQ